MCCRTSWSTVSCLPGMRPNHNIQIDGNNHQPISAGLWGRLDVFDSLSKDRASKLPEPKVRFRAVNGRFPDRPSHCDDVAVWYPDPPSRVRTPTM